jgi:hypothetical protein
MIPGGRQGHAARPSHPGFSGMEPHRSNLRPEADRLLSDRRLNQTGKEQDGAHVSPEWVNTVYRFHSRGEATIIPATPER